jgi:hypothetical protein
LQSKKAGIRLSRTDKEVIQNLSGGTARHEETEKRRNALLGFFFIRTFDLLFLLRYNASPRRLEYGKVHYRRAHGTEI